MGMKVLGQKPFPVSFHSAMSPTWNELRSSPGLRNDMPATNSLNNGTVTPQYEYVKYVFWILSNDRSTRTRQLVRKLLGRDNMIP